MDQEFSGAPATQSVWHTVTPFSKYAAMLLFISMPFIGGYIGYVYAPEKVVEVDRIVEVESGISSDERNKLLIREALVQNILNQDENIYNYVVDEPNGFDPYAYDPKARDLNINGLTFQSINRSEHLTTVEFGLNRYTDDRVLVSGNFELWSDAMFDGLVLRFVPDESTLQTLPWPNTTPQPYEKYLVVITGDYSLEDLCDRTCESELIENQRMLVYSGSAFVESVTLEIENIGVDSFGSSIKLFDLELTPLEV